MNWGAHVECIQYKILKYSDEIMDGSKTLSSLSRINSAIGVSLSQSILLWTSSFLTPLEKISGAFAVGFGLVATHPVTFTGDMMRSSVLHLWMTVITNLLLRYVEGVSSSFFEHLSWSCIVILLAERIHVNGILGEGSSVFLNSTKYIFADVVSSAVTGVFEGGGLQTLIFLFFLNVAVVTSCPSAAIRSAISLMVFDSVGNILFRFSSFPVLKILVALCLSVPNFSPHSFLDHIMEYSRWEASKELSNISSYFGNYKFVVFVFLYVFVRFFHSAAHLRHAVEDIVVLSLFNVIFSQSNAILQFVFAGNLLLSYLFTLVMLSFSRSFPSTFFHNN